MLRDDRRSARCFISSVNVLEICILLSLQSPKPAKACQRPGESGSSVKRLVELTFRFRRLDFVEFCTQDRYLARVSYTAAVPI